MTGWELEDLHCKMFRLTSTSVASKCGRREGTTEVDGGTDQDPQM